MLNTHTLDKKAPLPLMHIIFSQELSTTVQRHTANAADYSLTETQNTITLVVSLLKEGIPAHHSLVQLVAKVQKLLPFALQKLGQRDASPLGDDLSDVTLRHGI